MGAIDDIIADAREHGVRPWIAVKERLSQRTIAVMAESGGRAVLQGGAALHFGYGSPRLSADVDFVGVDVARALDERGPALARAATETLGCPSRWSMGRAGRLVRGKVTVTIDTSRRLVLPVEAYEVPARTFQVHGALGAIEEPAEIAADKIVASADRLARRGVLKITDLYDLWYIDSVLAAPAPERAAVDQKAADHEQPRHGADLAAAVASVTPEELRAVLEGLLPARDLAGLDEGAVLDTAAVLLGRYSDVL